MIVFGKYKGQRVVLKKVNDTYEVYPIGDVADSFPLVLQVSDPQIVTINYNRMSPRELRETLAATCAELVAVNDAWDEERAD